MKSIEEEIRRNILGEVRFDEYSKAMYSTDASIYQIDPVGVVIPRSYDDVIRVVEVANRFNIPILPRGGGTSLAGQTVNNAIVLDFTKFMNNVLDVNVEEQWAIVQPGITLDELNRQVKKFGLHYAPDPTTASRATIGGGIGNNSCGSHSIVYTENTSADPAHPDKDTVPCRCPCHLESSREWRRSLRHIGADNHPQTTARTKHGCCQEAETL